MSNHPDHDRPLAWLRDRRLLLVDAAGALVSALSLGLLLPALQRWIGLPVVVLWVLAGVAVLLCVVGLASWRLSGPHWRRALVGLALGNASYAVVTMALLVVHRHRLEWLGWVYFTLEIAVLAWLVRLEWKATRQPIE